MNAPLDGGLGEAEPVPPRPKAHVPPPTAIRSEPPRARRLSRKTLMAGALVIGGLFSFALIAGLSDADRGQPGGEQQGAETQTPIAPESVRGAPSSYDQVDLTPLEPELEPPRDMLWGDGGPPPGYGQIDNDQAADVAMTPRGPSPAEQAEAAARGSPILFGERASVRGGGGASPSGDGRHDGFMAVQRNSESVLQASLTAPSSRYLIQAGSVIPAALITSLSSDLPGRVIAQVTENVYDSRSGDHLLVPQGARLIGAYQSESRYGDRRILIAWNRLILPNGWSIDLQGMEATDAAGASGLGANVDNHLGRVAVASLLSGVLSVAANEAQDGESSGLSQSVGDASAQEAARIGARIVDRELDVRPTLRVPAGAPVRVLVSRDINLRPYRP